jgi:hypothetical protein
LRKPREREAQRLNAEIRRARCITCAEYGAKATKARPMPDRAKKMANTLTRTLKASRPDANR